MKININHLNAMKCGMGNIGCTREELKAWSLLVDPIISATTNQSLAAHEMPSDAVERMSKAEAMFLAIQNQNRLKNNARYL